MNRRGRPRVESRSVANAVLWILTTREPWSKLPAHFPSGPTCRRRFAEWRASGTLEKLAHALAATGRTLPSVARRQAAPESLTEKQPSVDTWGRVVWKNADSWKAPASPSSRPALDPMASITEQLAGAPESESPAGRMVESTKLVETGSSLLKSLCRCATEFADESGYSISAGFEQLSNGTYRAWAEIMEGRRRIERSGMIGPRFDHSDAAQQYALEWARQWIAGRCSPNRKANDVALGTVDAVGKGASTGDNPSAGIQQTEKNGGERGQPRCAHRVLGTDVFDRAPEPSKATETTKPCSAPDRTHLHVAGLTRRTSRASRRSARNGGLA